MRLPATLLAKLSAAGKPPGPRPRVRWFQLSLRTLFILTACFAVAAWFWQPLAEAAQGLWEIWFPRQPPPYGCGPCGMG